MKEREPRPTPDEAELIEVLYAISISSLRLARRLKAQAQRPVSKPIRYGCPLCQERRNRREALRG